VINARILTRIIISNQGEDKMKRIIAILVVLVFLAPGVAFGESQDIQKSMSISNPDMEFSGSCKILSDTAFITLSGSISTYGARDIWRDFKIIRHLGLNRVVVYMDNPGGAAFQGMGITDAVRALTEDGIEVVMEGSGLIASAAIPVYLAASRRIASKNTIFLIHPAAIVKWGLFSETLKDLQSQTHMMTLLQGMYADSVASRTNLTAEQVHDMMTKDSWFTADKAKEMGFVDEIR
jgi:ATP-dependent protease ClpP protease subunit